MSRYDVIFFDLDGTLTDPGLGITSSVAHALRRAGITPTPLRELYPFIFYIRLPGNFFRNARFMKCSI